MKRKLIGVTTVVICASLGLGGGYFLATEVFGFEHPASQLFATLGISGLIGCLITSILKAIRK